MNNQTAGKTVLVVAECGDSQAMVLEQAKKKGLSVITAADSQVAVATLAMTVPEVIVTELGSVEEAGLLWVRQIHERYPHSAIILLADRHSERILLEALRAGAVDCLRQPLTENELAGALDRALLAIPSTVADAPGVEQLEYRLVIGTDPAQAESTVGWLIQGTAMWLPDTHRLHLRAALLELVLNAIEHGSLEIFYREKQDALANDEYDDLVRQRRRHPRYAHRRVYIRATYDIDQRVLRYQIADEGRGFRWKSLLSRSSEPCSNHDANGRGLFLARSFFPQLTFNECGNEATLTVPLP